MLETERNTSLLHLIPPKISTMNLRKMSHSLSKQRNPYPLINGALKKTPKNQNKVFKKKTQSEKQQRIKNQISTTV